MMTNGVRDNPTLSRFELDINGTTAFSNYQRAPGIVTILHTEVPEALRGHGAGSALARGELDLVRASGDRVVAKCPFIAEYIARHKEYQDLLA
jgi:uncharacterized protein